LRSRPGRSPWSSLPRLLTRPPSEAEPPLLLRLDRAAWHLAKDLIIPGNLRLVFLPAYAPELNPIERVWLYLRERFLSERLWPTYDDILAACCRAWNTLLAEAGRIRSLCATDWARTVTT
jgi:transposase